VRDRAETVSPHVDSHSHVDTPPLRLLSSPRFTTTSPPEVGANGVYAPGIAARPSGIARPSKTQLFEGVHGGGRESERNQQQLGHDLSLRQNQREKEVRGNHE
jgi:hypothetical protein